MTVNPVDAKRELRQSILAHRRSQDNQEHAFADRLIGLMGTFNVKKLGCYISFGSEPSTQEIIHRAEQFGIDVYCPKIVADEMNFALWTGETEKSAQGFESPVSDRFTNDLDLLVVPALAVSANGIRLGRGGGYFDRYLTNFKGVTVALVFDNEVLKEIPTESHDLPVQYSITENRTLKHG